MKQIFFDKTKLTVVKVFSGAEMLEREICGIKSFRDVARVPTLNRLDNKVAAISLIDGFLGYQVSQGDLNLRVAELLLNLKPVRNPSNFTIFQEIEILKERFGSGKLTDQLESIKKIISRVFLYPVHGDLQKQNIIICHGEVVLIDFEHFLFAPRELELCNSLFFNDGNCLDIMAIVGIMPKGTINKKILKAMLQFFSLKQISLGMSQKKAEKRLDSALNKINMLKLERFSAIKLRTLSFCCF